jgi:hypothetical protein
MTKKNKESFQKTMKMGLGEAIRRLIRVEMARYGGLGDKKVSSAEVDMIYEALNTQKLDLGFDCNDDGVPDTVEIFTQSSHTSCCRLIPADTSRVTKSSPRRKASTSRKGKKK